MSNMSTPPSPRYLTILCEFMAFFHEKPKTYAKDHEFSEDELTVITPVDVVRWMNVKAFGIPYPEPEAKLTGSGSSSLEFMKKAISFYMPNKENWDHDRGNPTKSRQVKELMQRVAALGGERKKKKEDITYQEHSMSVVVSDGPHGLLQRMHAQNTDFINILNTMGSALRTFSRSVDHMKSALETNNIAIRHELSHEAEDGNDTNKEDGAAAIAIADEVIPDAAEMTDIPERAGIDTEMKDGVARVAESLRQFMNNNIVENRDMSILSRIDGFCTFSSNKTGKHMDVPDGFILPSCDLLRAWRHWIIGFPDFKIRNDNDEIVDAPIRPLRVVNTSDLPQSLKKKFKDGWRPILLSMQGDVTQMLDTTPVAAMDEKFIRNTYSTAMNALFAKAPGIFAETGSEKYGTWKVATWSRKIREQQLGQQQVRRRQEQSSGFAPLKTKEQQMEQPSP